jgi:hypothetical protein
VCVSACDQANLVLSYRWSYLPLNCSLHGYHERA